jgi:thiol-disulfide isomerase/thioredoxin
MSRKALLAILLCSCSPAEPPAAPSEVVVDQEPARESLSGQVLGHDGKPMAAAYLSVSRSNFRDKIFDGELGPDGRFRVELPGPGVYSMRLAGVDHAEARTSFLVEAGDVEVHARLGTYARAPTTERVLVRLRWIDEGGTASDAIEGEAIAGEPNVYTLALDPPANARAVQYQIVDPSGRSFNGPGGVRWVYDGGGDFWAERPLDASATLELELNSLPPIGRERVLDVEGEQVVMSRQSAAQRVLEPYQSRLKQEVFAAKLEPQLACSKLRDIALEARAAVEVLDDAELRAAGALEWLWFFGQFDFGAGSCLAVDDLLWTFDLAPADHPAWAFVATVVGNVFIRHFDDERLRDFRRRLAAEQRDEGLLAHLVYVDIWDARGRGDTDAVARLYSQLAGEFVGSVPAFWARQHFDPNRPLQVGRAMPDWRFAGLDGEMVSSEKLRGRPYLLVVWATWCGPCVEEMKSLHATHDALGGERGPIAFVSVSMDEGIGEVERFRRDKWPMPWTHAHVPPAEHAALYDAWGFSGVPVHMLVDDDGTIAAAEGSLRGEELLPTLQGFLEARTRSVATARTE